MSYKLWNEIHDDSELEHLVIFFLNILICSISTEEEKRKRLIIVIICQVKFAYLFAFISYLYGILYFNILRILKLLYYCFVLYTF